MNRRSLLIGGAALSVAPFAAVTKQDQTPQNRLDTAVKHLLSAMADIHGDQCSVIRTGNKIISFVAPLTRA